MFLNNWYVNKLLIFTQKLKESKKITLKKLLIKKTVRTLP